MEGKSLKHKFLGDKTVRTEQVLQVIEMFEQILKTMSRPKERGLETPSSKMELNTD